jgi:hypothetical protein
LEEERDSGYNGVRDPLFSFEKPLTSISG